ncbi:hypothetical protein RIF29_32353 [Crotalaria pallida]|uniref:Cytochrome P450 n=1 Tax=Crotalaria pallida TaxID=3830 RepID=A0AAN9EI13_CROPI
MEFLVQSFDVSTIVFLLLTLIAFIAFFLLPLRRKLSFPPGPKGLPIIGNLLMMDQLTHRGLAQLAKRYGPLCHLQMGSLHIVAVSTPDMAREVLQTQDGAFSNRPANVAISYLSYDRADMAFANCGPFWRQMRKLCVIKLFSRRRAESWASVRDEVEKTVQTVAKNVGSPINFGEAVFSLTRRITFKAAFGSSLDDGEEEFMGILQEFSKLFGAFNIADFFPWLGWLQNGDFNKRMANARKALDVFIDKIIDEHVAKRKNNMEKKKEEDDVDTDMVDELMVFLKEGEDAHNTHSDNSQSALKLNRDNIKALIMDVMFGGTETVASAIEWAMAELMKNPLELLKVQQELADVVGLDRKFNESDLEKLTYLKCVVKETLRLHPPIPVFLHEAAENIVLADYSIPKGARVMVNAWTIGRHKSAWDDPETFNPSRFLNDGIPDFKGSNFEFIPFGSGRRSCPGMQLGLYGVDMTLAHLLHCFNWELPNGMKPSELDMSDVYGLSTPKAIRLVVVPSYRLNCPL